MKDLLGMRLRQAVLTNKMPVQSLALIMILFSTHTASAQLNRSTIYIPLAENYNSHCRLSLQEERLAQLLAEHHAQQRATFICNSLLVHVAREKAKDMATRDNFDHVTPDGLGPNYLARQGGVRLPDFYSTDITSNNIESIAAGYKSADSVWKGLLNSAGHRAHLLAEEGFYAEQTEYGIGHYYLAENNLYRHYWVIMTAPAAGDSGS